MAGKGKKGRGWKMTFERSSNSKMLLHRWTRLNLAHFRIYVTKIAWVPFRDLRGRRSKKEEREQNIMPFDAT